MNENIYIFIYRARGLFDDHINISPEDKTLAIERILLAQADFILFADTSYDSRVFALAHERYVYIYIYIYMYTYIFVHVLIYMHKFLYA
jgi:hypothetical protein